MERYYNDGTEPTVLPHMRCCTGPCQQGRQPCPAPEACEQPEPATSKDVTVFITAMLVLIVVLLIAAVVSLLT